MKQIKNVLLVAIALMLGSCDVLLKSASSLIEQEKPLTSTDVAKGLKEALRVGVDTAVVRLNATNGYYLDEGIKIDLPPETGEVVEYARKVPGLDKMIEDLILQINRSAEDAAAQAAPVFSEAILSMDIEDAWSVLNGTETAATQYLKNKTYYQLVELYRPAITTSLNKPLAGNVSALSTWKKLSGTWNDFATSFAGKLLKVKTVESDLAGFVTAQALEGVFVKISEQEKEIRTNVNARVNPILKRVFEKAGQEN